MKNQGYWAMRLITLVLIVFVAGYMGFHMIDALSLRDSVRSVTCVLVRTEDARPVTGLFVRDELLMPMPDGTLRYAVSDGERVSGGQAVAMRYQDSRVLEKAAELRALENRLEQLLYIDNRAVSPSDSAQAKTMVYDAIRSVRDTVDSGRWLMLRQECNDLRDALFRQEYTLGDRGDLTERIGETRASAASLRAEIEMSHTTVTAPRGGLFVSAADGYESLLNPSAAAIGPAELDALLKAKPEKFAVTTGKLITDSVYCYVFTIPESEVRHLGGSVTLRFHDERAAFTQSMDVESISQAEDGRCTVTLSSRRYLSRFYNRRRMDAAVIYQEYEGLRVPREAVRLDEDGGYFVYCRVLSQVVQKNIDVIMDVERENFYLCRYEPGHSRNLLPGDEIITVGKDLYDGKVLS